MADDDDDANDLVSCKGAFAFELDMASCMDLLALVLSNIGAVLAFAYATLALVAGVVVVVVVVVVVAQATRLLFSRAGTWLFTSLYEELK